MLWLALALLAVLVVAHAVAVLYLANLFTRSPRRRVEGAPADLGLRYENAWFEAADGTLLRAWYLESPGARASVVLIHDWRGTRSTNGFLRLQRDYLRSGLHVLAFDLRSRGESAGRRDQLGARERMDVAAAVAFARRAAPGLPVVLHGMDLGAVLAIDAAASGSPVAAVVADSPFLSPRHALRRRHSRVPGYLFDTALWAAGRLFRADVDALQPRAAAAQLEAPVLFVHNTQDPQTPVADTVNLAAATTHMQVQVWTPEGAGHCTAYLDQPDAYRRRCLALVDEAVPVRLATATAG